MQTYTHMHNAYIHTSHARILSNKCTFKQADTGVCVSECVCVSPRFKVEQKVDLRESLQELGIKNIFTKDADLSAMTGEIADTSPPMTHTLTHTLTDTCSHALRCTHQETFTSALFTPDASMGCVH